MRIDVVVLETIGARTGTTRSTVVAAVPGPDDSLLIGGGAAGRSCTPDWVANLRANPSVAVTRSRRHYSAVAEELHNEARDAALVAIAEQWPAVEGYERRSGRRTPVFHLEPESATAPS